MHFVFKPDLGEKRSTNGHESKGCLNRIWGNVEAVYTFRVIKGQCQGSVRSVLSCVCFPVKFTARWPQWHISL